MLRPTLVLLALALAPACTKPDPATDTDDPSTGTTGDDTTDTTGDTTTGETTGETTGNTTGNTTGDEFPACVDPDPSLDASYGFDLSAWAPDFDPNGMGPSVTIDAACVVASFTRDGGSVSFDLSCTEGPLVDVSIPVTLAIPADMPVPLAVDDAVRLRYSGHGFEHHTSPGDQFALHDESGAALLLAGFDEMWGVSGWSQIATPLTIDTVDDVCPTVCGEGGCEDDGTRRDGVRVDDGSEDIVVVDRDRGTLAGAFDIVVAAAQWNNCLNCFGTYRIVISAVAAP